MKLLHPSQHQLRRLTSSVWQQFNMRSTEPEPRTRLLTVYTCRPCQRSAIAQLRRTSAFLQLVMRWAIVTLLVAGQAEGGACPDFENLTRPMWSIHGGKVDLVKRSEGKVMAKVRWVESRGCHCHCCHCCCLCCHCLCCYCYWRE